MNNWSTRAAVFFVGLCLPFACWGQSPKLEFKGLHPGADGTWLLTHAAWTCNAKKLSGGDTVCHRKHETIAGAETELVMATLKQSTVLTVYISFPQTSFNQVLDALTLKYGQPQQLSTSTKKNRLGAEFASRTAQWRQEPVYARLEERAGRVDQSAFYINSTDAMKDALQQRAEESQKNKEDL